MFGVRLGDHGTSDSLHAISRRHVRIRDLDARVVLHDAPETPVSIGGFEVVAQHVIHPGHGHNGSSRTGEPCYLLDHEPALGARQFPEEPWTSGFDLASGVDLLIHDGQYSDDERAGRIGWGHQLVSRRSPSRS
jgi:hypothetical protein